MVYGIPVQLNICESEPLSQVVDSGLPAIYLYLNYYLKQLGFLVSHYRAEVFEFPCFSVSIMVFYCPIRCKASTLAIRRMHGYTHISQVPHEGFGRHPDIRTIQQDREHSTSFFDIDYVIGVSSSSVILIPSAMFSVIYLHIPLKWM